MNHDQLGTYRTAIASRISILIAAFLLLDEPVCFELRLRRREDGSAQPRTIVPELSDPPARIFSRICHRYSRNQCRPIDRKEVNRARYADRSAGEVALGQRSGICRDISERNVVASDSAKKLMQNRFATAPTRYLVMTALGIEA